MPKLLIVDDCLTMFFDAFEAWRLANCHQNEALEVLEPTFAVDGAALEIVRGSFMLY